ncbi:MAG TPA: MlaD family protein [Myxococcota bacterium]|nr:MlaD family protein [Myxococcota bacterium]
MITRAQKVRLGVFVAASLALFVGTLVVLAGIRLVERRDTYTVRYHMSLSGLEPGAQVKYNGVRVGSVETIRINPQDVGEVIVTLSLEAGTPIKADTKAVVNLAGITGLKFIELSGGTSGSPFIAPGGEIQPGESIFDRLTGRAEAIAEKIELVVNQIADYTTAEKRERFYQVVDHVDELIVTTRGTIEENRANVLRISTTLGGSAERLDRTLVELEADAKRTLRAIRSLSEGLEREIDARQVRRVVTNVERVTADLKVAVERADVPAMAVQVRDFVGAARRVADSLELTILRGREDVFASLAYLLETLENLTEFSRLIRETPSLLLGSSEEQERKLK